MTREMQVNRQGIPRADRTWVIIKVVPLTDEGNVVLRAYAVKKQWGQRLLWFYFELWSHG